MSVDNFKTNIYEYLENLPTLTFMRLFEKPATCLAIFRYRLLLIYLKASYIIMLDSYYRLLPSIGRHIVMSLLYVEEDMSLHDINSWVNNDGQK
jgi:transcription initiation factor TFIIH subunit 4